MKCVVGHYQGSGEARCDVYILLALIGISVRSDMKTCNRTFDVEVHNF